MTWRALPGDGGRPPRKVGVSLGAVTQAMGGPSARAFVELVTRWEELVGPTLATHSRPLRLSSGTLTVAVDQPAWATEVRWFEADLRARVEAAMGPGVVERLTVTVKPADPPDKAGR